jgi:hypothetical protein
MKAEFIDARDQTLKVDDPTYRVYFWAEVGDAKDEWELSGGYEPRSRLPRRLWTSRSKAST